MIRFEKPWGYYEVIYREDHLLIKLLHLKADKSIHLQLHHHRSETWKVLEGGAIARIGEDNFFPINSNSEPLFIDKEQVHKLIAVTDCTILEIQKGDLLDEKDIEHLD